MAPSRSPKLSRPKIPKFNGKQEVGLTIEAFIRLFERAFRAVTDDEKIDRLMEFLEGEAADFYGADVLLDPAITWTDVCAKLNARYAHTDIQPMVAATRRRLQHGETVRKYFDDKTRILRRVPALPEVEVTGLLTDGLPEAYRNHFLGSRLTASEWLQKAQDIEAELKRRPPPRPFNRTSNQPRVQNTAPTSGRPGAHTLTAGTN